MLSEQQTYDFFNLYASDLYSNHPVIGKQRISRIAATALKELADLGDAANYCISRSVVFEYSWGQDNGLGGRLTFRPQGPHEKVAHVYVGSKKEEAIETLLIKIHVDTVGQVPGVADCQDVAGAWAVIEKGLA